VLGNLLALREFEYDSSEQVREELRALVGAMTLPAGSSREVGRLPADEVVPVPIYGGDAVVRRSVPLQRTALAAGLAPTASPRSAAG
jgi:hypothetical protein